MAYMTFPAAVLPDDAEWSNSANSMVHTSPLTGAEDVLELPGAKWVVALSFKDLTDRESVLLESFITSCRGKARGFWLWNHRRPTPYGSALGAPVVYGANQTGGTLITNGWQANAQNVLLPGDFIGVGNELKMVRYGAPVNADAAGRAEIQLEPPLRASPANGAAIVLSSPKALFRLNEDRNPYKYSGSLNSYSLTCVEWI